MTLDLNRYRHVIKPIVKLTIERDPGLDKPETLQLIAQATNCHIVAVGHYMAELYGMTPELQRKIAMLVSFYHIDSIINQEAFSETL